MDEKSREILAADIRSEIVGKKLPGGCLDCGVSFHEWIEPNPGEFHYWIEHEETCPVLRAARGEG